MGFNASALTLVEFPDALLRNRVGAVELKAQSEPGGFEFLTRTQISLSGCRLRQPGAWKESCLTPHLLRIGCEGLSVNRSICETAGKQHSGV